MNRYTFIASLSLLSSCTPTTIPPTYLHYNYSTPEQRNPECPLEKIVERDCPSVAATNEPVKEQKQDSISPEYRALLDTIAWAEGTTCNYNMMIGRMLFTDYSAHPIDTGEMPPKGFEFGPRWRKRYSTAAGRYQFLHRTYLKLKEEGFFSTGFNPEEQDKAALQLIQKSGVTQEMLEKAITEKVFEDIWDALSGEWASLPLKKTKRSRYRHQYAYKQENLQKIYFYYYLLKSNDGQ